MHSTVMRRVRPPPTPNACTSVFCWSTDIRSRRPNVSEVRPVTPGEVVVAAYDFQGQQQWLSRAGKFVSAHGFCSNPVLYQDLVIINGDHDGDSWIAALDRHTGQTVWRQARPHGIRSYVTPLIRTAAGRPQLVLSGSKCVMASGPK